MILSTKRLWIRPTEMADLDAIHEMLADESTMRFFVEGTYEKENIKAMIEDNQNETKHYSLVLKETNEVIGKISFHPWFMDRTYEMGWIMNVRHANRGYMSEATGEMLRYGFEELDLHRVVATCQPENIASRRICEKLGMRLEGTFRKCIHFKDDEWWDELFFAILGEEHNKD